MWINKVLTMLDRNVVGYHLIRNWEKYLIFAAGAGLGFKPTRAMTSTAIKWTGAKVLAPIAKGGAIAAANVLRAVALPLATGYAIGAVTGTLIAEKFWGESGKEDAVQLYTGQVSWDDYWSTIGEGLDIWMNK